MKWNHSTSHCASTWHVDIIFCSLPSLRVTSKPDLDSIFLKRKLKIIVWMNTIRRLQRQLVVSHKAILCIINTIKYYYTSPHNETKEQLCTDWVSCKHWSMMFLCTLIHFCLTANKFVDTELFTNFFLPKKQRFSKTHKSQGQGLTAFVTTFLRLCEE